MQDDRPRELEVLTAEHRVLRQLTDVLGAMTEHLAASRRVPTRDLETVLAIVEGVGIARHAGREEEALPPLLGRVWPAKGGPVARRIAGHHQAGHELAAEMRAHARLASSGIGRGRDAFVDAARRYVALLDRELTDESEMLLPRLPDALDAGQRASVTLELAKLDRARVGDLDLSAVARSLEDLRQRYRPAPAAG